MNLFPLPVLDGGHLVFLAAEAIKGKPVSERVQNLSYRIGLTILLIETIFVLLMISYVYNYYFYRIKSMKNF